MNFIQEQFKQIIITMMLLLVVGVAGAQVKGNMSHQFKWFSKATAKANVEFALPAGFKEIKAPDSDDFPFDYAMEIPGKEFEIWFQVKSQKENIADYARTQNTPLASPDSLYNIMGEANALAFTGDKKYFTRNIPPQILTRYGADAGKSYLLNLLDMPATKHYKYALLITLQKNHAGTIMAVCLTNLKGSEFFKNISGADGCIKFKP
jgi:hypothetical protein